MVFPFVNECVVCVENGSVLIVVGLSGQAALHVHRRLFARRL